MVIEELVSKYSGKLQVIKTFPWSKPYLSTGFLTQSGGLVYDVWKPILSLLKNPTFKSVLILGLSGGTLANMIHKIRPDIQITGIEIDPIMIYLGKKYLGLDKIPNLKIIIGDAQNNLSKADVIFVDMYLNDQVPDFVYSAKFLKKLNAKLVIFNHLFYDDIKKSKAHALITQLETLKNHVQITRVLTNVLIIATPKTRRQNHTPLRQTAS